MNRISGKVSGGGGGGLGRKGEPCVVRVRVVKENNYTVAMKRAARCVAEVGN